MPMPSAPGRVLAGAAVGALAALMLASCSTGKADTGGGGGGGGSNSGPATSAPATGDPTTEQDAVQFRQAAPGSGKGVKIGLIALDDSVPFSKLVSDSVRKQA